MARFNLLNLNTPTNHRRGGGERSGLNAIWHHAMCCAVQRVNALDLNHIWRSARNLSAHTVEERDQIVNLWFLRSGSDARCPLCKNGGEHGVLRPHHRDVWEGDLRAAESAAALCKVVTIAVIDLRAECAHCINVQIHRATPNAIATRVADDDATESRKEWAEQHEACAHFCRRFKRNEEPFNVAGSEIHAAVCFSLNGDAKIAQCVAQHFNVKNFWHVL